MRAVLQRVRGARLSVGGKKVSEIGEGLVVYLGGQGRRRERVRGGRAQDLFTAHILRRGGKDESFPAFDGKGSAQSEKNASKSNAEQECNQPAQEKRLTLVHETNGFLFFLCLASCCLNADSVLCCTGFQIGKVNSVKGTRVIFGCGCGRRFSGNSV